MHNLYGSNSYMYVWLINNRKCIRWLFFIKLTPTHFGTEEPSSGDLKVQSTKTKKLLSSKLS